MKILREKIYQVKKVILNRGEILATHRTPNEILYLEENIFTLLRNNHVIMLLK